MQTVNASFRRIHVNASSYNLILRRKSEEVMWRHNYAREYLLLVAHLASGSSTARLNSTTKISEKKLQLQIITIGHHQNSSSNLIYITTNFPISLEQGFGYKAENKVMNCKQLRRAEARCSLYFQQSIWSHYFSNLRVHATGFAKLAPVNLLHSNLQA